MEIELNRPAPTTSTASTETRAAADDAAGNIDKVRDILFGGQMREYERRFTRLEERLSQEIADLREDVRKRVAALEQFVTQETSSLGARITTEHEERTDATRSLETAARDAVTAFEKKTGQLDDQIGRAQRELRQQILELEQRMTDDVRRKTDDVSLRLGQEAADLRSDKTDRATLAALLTEMAMRLTTDLPMPGRDDGKRG